MSSGLAGAGGDLPAAEAGLPAAEADLPAAEAGLPAAVLWDMDGLLVDSEPLWTVAETELAAELGGAFTPELKARIVGTRLEVAVPVILEWYGHASDPASVTAASDWLLGRMVELFAGELPLLPGVRELLASVAAAGVAQALVSSSYRRLVEAFLVQGLGPFAVTVAGDEVERGKPDPEPYLLAARLLAVDPSDCLVVEDSPSGARSGLAAGCAVLAVPSVAGVRIDPAPRLCTRSTLVGLDVADLGRLVWSSGSGPA